MSCYLPMIEKLKTAAASKHRPVGEKSKSIPSKSNSFEYEQQSSSNRYSNNEGYDSEPPPYDSIHGDEIINLEHVTRGHRGPLPRRDQAGFTITQNIGEFPNRVPLHIRYDVPRLALSDVAFQRQHQLHHHDVQRLPQSPIQQYTIQNQPNYQNTSQQRQFLDDQQIQKNSQEQHRIPDNHQRQRLVYQDQLMHQPQSLQQNKMQTKLTNQLSPQNFQQVRNSHQRLPQLHRQEPTVNIDNHKQNSMQDIKSHHQQTMLSNQTLKMQDNIMNSAKHQIQTGHITQPQPIENQYQNHPPINQHNQFQKQPNNAPIGSQSQHHQHRQLVGDIQQIQAKQEVPPHQQQNFSGSPMNSRGVLSLGLPTQLIPNSIFRRNAKPPNGSSQLNTLSPPPSASSDLIHHTYETLNSRHYSLYSPETMEQNRSRPTRRYNREFISRNNNKVCMQPPAQIQSRLQNARGSSLPRRAKKIPSSAYNQILLQRPKSVQDDLILSSPDEGLPEPYGVTSLDPPDDLDSSCCHDVTIKTTDSGQTSGCSSGASTAGSQSPKSQANLDAITALPPQPPQRQSAFTTLPNRGPPPRHLIPATLKPSPRVKMHPPDIMLNFRQQPEYQKEIADNAACSVEESSSATEESDSIGSNRNSSPDAAASNQIRREMRLSTPELMSQKFASKLNSSPSPLIESSNKLGRLSPMVTGNASAKLQRQILSSRYTAATTNTSDWGYHSMGVRGPAGMRITPSSASSLESVPRSSPDFWDVRATKTPVRELRLASTNALSSKRSPAVSSTSSPKLLKNKSKRASAAFFDKVPDNVVLKILSYLNTNDLVRCSRVSRRFYFLAWEPDLWCDITLTGENTDADLALKTIMRLLSRNSVKHSPLSLILNGCQRLTDRGLAIIARTCPQLTRLEVQNCINVTNGGLMDLVSKCQMIDHLDVSGCHMISTISVHQPPPSPAHRGLMHRGGPTPQPLRRLLNLQYLDLTDCESVEDSGLKMVVENCPQLIYLFLRRCSAITDLGVKSVASYCLHLRELSVSDCLQITDFGIYEVAKLGPNLRYLSVAKCNRITDAGVKQIARLCYKLRYLNVRGCESVSDDAIEMLARSCSRLRSLDIGKCDVTDVGLKLLSEHCQNLKKLSVKSCEMVSDVGIQSVAYYCRGLQQLNIQDCPVTVEGYRTVKKFCKRCIIEHSHPGFF